MTEDGQTDHEILPLVSNAFPGEGIHAVQRVYPNVSLGMPFGVLFATDQAFEFGEMP